MRCPYCNNENTSYASECYFCHKPISSGSISEYGSTPQYPPPQGSQTQYNQYPQQTQYTQPPQYQTSQPQYPQPQQGTTPYQQPLEVQPFAYPPIPPPKKKSSWPLICGTVVVVIIIIVAIAAIAFVLSPEENNESSSDDNGSTNGDDNIGDVYPGAKVTAKQLWDDWNTYSGDFKGLKAGDTVYIRDKIKEIDNIDVIYSYNVNWTLITFDTTDISVNSFYSGDVSDKELWGIMIFNGDLTGDYSAGDLVEVRIYISNYDMGGQTAEMPAWYTGIMDAYGGDIEYQDINFPGSDRISHA